MKKITKKILYREHSVNNKVTDEVDQETWFEVETQMNRGPDSKDVDKELVETFNKYRDDIVLTKDIEIDENNILFSKNFNSYDFKFNKFIDKKRNVLFLNNIVGEDLFNVIKYSDKVIAFHGMMTSLGFLLKKPVLDLFHCKINSWEDYRRYRNSFYEFKPQYDDYDFIIPKKDINKTINKIKFSLKKCQIK